MTRLEVSFIRMVGVTLLAFLIQEIRRRYQAYRFAKSLRPRDPNAVPDPLDAEPMLPEFADQRAALVLLMNGETARADELMARTEWRMRPEALRAAKDGYDAVRAYLRGKYEAGYEAIMRQARVLRIAVDSVTTDYTGSFVLADIGRVLAQSDADAEVRLRTKVVPAFWEPLVHWTLLQVSINNDNIQDMAHFSSALKRSAPHAQGLGVASAFESADNALTGTEPSSETWSPPKRDPGRTRSRIGMWITIAVIVIEIGFRLAAHWPLRRWDGRSWFELPKYPLELRPQE